MKYLPSDFTVSEIYWDKPVPELVDMIILDFNKDFVIKAGVFQKDFNELINQLKKL